MKKIPDDLLTKINAREVVDAKSDATIDITMKDADNGFRKTCLGCPASLSAMRDIVDCTEARIFRSVAYLRIKNKWVRYFVSGELRANLIAHDKGGKFSPGPYTLKKVPKYAIEGRGKAHSYGAPKHGRDGHERKPYVGLRQCAHLSIV